MTQPKAPRFFGFAKRPQLDVVDGGKAVKDNDKLSESLLETLAGGASQTGEVDPAISLAQTRAAADAGRETREPAKETGPVSFAHTLIRSDERVPAEPAESGPALVQTRIAGADEADQAVRRSRGGDGLAVSLAQTLSAEDPSASASLPSEPLDRDSLGLARTLTPAADAELSAPSRPSLRRDEAITDDPELSRRLLAPEADDGRLKDLIRARLFRKSAAPVKIGRFTILDRLGEGGMGVVYTAYDDKLDRKIAIKVMRSESGDPSGRTRLIREAQAMARLTHPHIVTVHEVGEVDGQVFVAMEHVRGQSLDRWLQEPRPWPEVVGVFTQAGRGLQAAHDAGLIHRDFKPHNVLLAEDGTAKVLDFGLARSVGQLTGEVPEEPTALAKADEKALSLLDQRLTRTGAIMGTPAYMAPEQHEGKPATARSDQFSFAVALYEGLYGELPFEAGSLATLIANVIGGKIKEAPASAKVPAWLRKVVLRGLAVDPALRYPTIADLLVDLARDPALRRRRWLATAGFAAIVGGAGFGLASAGTANAAICEGGEAEIAAVWGDAQRGEVEAALSGAGVDYAAETWEKVRPALDAYAGEWAAMRGEACESHRSGANSDRLFDLRTACLDLRKAELDGLVGVLRAADPTVVENAAKAAASLTPLASCADTKALTAAVAPPADAATADAVEAIRGELAHARALELTGKYAEGLTVVDGLLDRARVLGYAPLTAEVELGKGRLSLESSDGKAADEALSAALYTALGAGHDPVALEALSRRIFVKDYLLGRPEDALADAPLGQALLERVGEDPAALGLLLHNRATAELHAGHIDVARDLFDASLAAKRAAFGERHPEIGYTESQIGVLLLGEERFEEAAPLFDEALAIFRESLGANHPHVSVTELNLGLAHLGGGKVKAAITEIDHAVDSARQHYGERSLITAMFLGPRASAHIAARSLTEALADTNAGIEMIESELGEDSPKLILFLGQLGRIEALLGDSARAREALDRAVAIASTSDAPDPTVHALALDWYGTALFDLGEREEALTHFLAAEAIRTEKLPPGTASLALTLWNLGETYTALGRLDEAADALARAREIVDAKAPPRSQLRARFLRAAAELAIARGDAAEATARAREALAIHEATRDAGDGELALTRFTLARAFALSEPGSGEARELAGKALAALQAGGAGWAREAREADTWLKGQK
ncbi:MAG: tetratricopeptide repeat protein [Myxococcales bacterium]|nr:tetratricopeptide repeat protein [Myxococcales bacterium]